MVEGRIDYIEKALYTYSLKHLKIKDKVRFYYALKGRDGKTGIIKLYSIEQLAKGVLLVSNKSTKNVSTTNESTVFIGSKPFNGF